MYQQAYAEIMMDSSDEAKEREREILARSISMLEAAKEKGPQSLEAAQAIHFLNRVWKAFIEDLGSEENGLPPELRANLISVGLWLVGEAEEIRQGRSRNFDGLIEVSQSILDGLQPQAPTP